MKYGKMFQYDEAIISPDVFRFNKKTKIFTLTTKDGTISMPVDTALTFVDMVKDCEKYF